MDNGDKYEGETKNGKPHGKGVLINSDGEKYEGEFKNGKENGKGTVTSKEGKIEGEFKNGKLNGKGTSTLEGIKYEGEFKNDKMHGQGTLIYEDGEKYVGEYKNNKRHGKGIFTFANGAKYKGEFKDGKRHGKGTLTFVNGAKYEGEYKNNKLNGKCTITYAEGEKYEGEYKNNKRHGKGTFTSADGIKCIEEYKDGKKISNKDLEMIYLVVDHRVKSTTNGLAQTDFFNFISSIKKYYFKIIMGFSCLEIGNPYEDTEFGEIPIQRNLSGSSLFLLAIEEKYLDQFLLKMKKLKDEINSKTNTQTFRTSEFNEVLLYFPFINLDFLNLIEWFNKHDRDSIEQITTMSFTDDSYPSCYGFKDRKIAETSYLQKMVKSYKPDLDMGSLYLEYNINSRHQSMLDLKKVQDYFYYTDDEKDNKNNENMTSEELDEIFFDFIDLNNKKKFPEQFRRISQIFPELTENNFIHKDNFLYDHLDYWVAQCINYYLHNDLETFPNPTSYNKTDFQIPYNYHFHPNV